MTGRPGGVVSGGCHSEGMSPTTAQDYTWFGERFPVLAGAYCVMLVRGLPPEDLLKRLNVTGEVSFTGVRRLEELTHEAWATQDGNPLFVGVTAVGEWSLMLEYNGCLGVTNELVAPLSVGTTLVSHYTNINGVDHFNWFEDGGLRLHFQPLFPCARDGEDPDGLVPVMREVGCDFDEDDPRVDLVTETAFALGERLTGVRITPGLLDSAEFVGGLVRVR